MNTLKNLKTLVLMQISDKLDIRVLASLKATIFALLYKLIAMGIFTGIIYYLFTAGSYIRILNLSANHNPMIFFFGIISLISLVTCTLYLMNTFYFSRDNQILFTLPTSSSIIFLSKLLVAYIIELKRNLTFILPFFIAYGVFRSGLMPWYYFLAIVFFFLLLTLAIVITGAILSLPAMFITIILKRIPFLHIISFIVVYYFYLSFIGYVMDNLPDKIKIIAQFNYYDELAYTVMTGFNKVTVVFGYLIQLALGTAGYFKVTLLTIENLKILSIFIGYIVVGIVFILFVTRYVFFFLISNQFGRTQKKSKRKKWTIKLPSFVAPFIKELNLLIRSSNSFFQTVLFPAIMPPAILLLNLIYLKIDVRPIGGRMMLVFDILLLLLLTLASLVPIASSFHKEEALSSMKTQPVNFVLHILSKIWIQVLLVIISTAISVYIIVEYRGLASQDRLVLILTLSFIIIGFVAWALQIDLAKIKKGNAELIANGLALGLSGLFAGALYMFLDEEPASAFLRILAISIILLISRLYILFKYGRIYFNEI